MTRLVYPFLTTACCLMLRIYSAGLPVHLQTATTAKPRLAFEVVAIHPSPATTGMHIQMALCHGIDTRLPTTLPVAPPPLGHCQFRLWTVRDMIGTAYLDSTILIDQFVTGGPSWLATDTFDVDGKAEEPMEATEADLKTMLQTFLAETFKLKCHTQPRQFDGLALVATRSAEELRMADGNALRSLQVDANGSLTAQNESMADLAHWIGQRLRRPVIDRTNLTGRYTFTLQNVVGQDGSIFQVLSEQLSLRLEAQKVTVDTIVIDHVEKP